jgi:hypothetical protein
MHNAHDVFGRYGDSERPGGLAWRFSVAFHHAEYKSDESKNWSEIWVDAVTTNVSDKTVGVGFLPEPYESLAFSVKVQVRAKIYLANQLQVCHTLAI